MKTMYLGRYLGVERCEFAIGLNSHARKTASDATSSSSLQLLVWELPSALNIMERCTLAATGKRPRIQRLEHGLAAEIDLSKWRQQRCLCAARLREKEGEE
jgi:hypothetical protein